MATDSAHKLALEAKRTIGLPTLPSYQSDLVRNIVREVRALFDSANSTINSLPPGDFDPVADPATNIKIAVEVSSMRRNKRCLLAYHHVRTGKIAEGVWKGVDYIGTDGGDGMDEDLEGVEAEEHMGKGKPGNALSPEEDEYARGYADLLAAVKAPWMDVDLTGSLVPPRNLFVDVRVLRDAGEIQTEYGAINLTKNSQFYVRQADVERLIEQGYLQKLG